MSSEQTGRPDPDMPDPALPGGATPPAGQPVSPPDWWEDTDLAVAVAEVEQFAAAGGWDAPPQMFALVSTADLLAAEPQLAGGLDAASVFTPIAQESLPEGELADALARILWPPEVVGCVLVQEIVVLPPSAAESLSEDPARAAGEAAEHPEKAEARLTAGVLRGMAGGACLLRLRGDHEQDPLRGADLAPHLLTALRATFEE